MIRPLTDEQCHALGLSGVQWSIAGRTEWPADDTPRGFVGDAGAVATFAAHVTTRFADASFLPVVAEPAASVGIAVELLEGSPSVVKVRCREEYDATPRFSGLAGPVGIFVDPDDPATAVFDLAAIQIGAVVLTDGGSLVLWKDSATGDLGSQFGVPSRIEIEPLASIEAPLNRWLEDCRDSWIARELRQRVELRDPWQTAVVVGLYARLLDGDAEQRRADVTAILRGEAPAPTARVLEWASALTTAQIVTLKRLAEAEALIVTDRLTDLAEHGNPADEVWEDEIQELCRRRDDLECVWQLLPPLDSDEPLVRLVADLDRAGARVSTLSPFVTELADERLWRVRLGNPDAWWAASAICPNSDD